MRISGLHWVGLFNDVASSEDEKINSYNNKALGLNLQRAASNSTSLKRRNRKPLEAKTLEALECDPRFWGGAGHDLSTGHV